MMSIEVVYKWGLWHMKSQQWFPSLYMYDISSLDGRMLCGPISSFGRRRRRPLVVNYQQRATTVRFLEFVAERLGLGHLPSRWLVLAGHPLTTAARWPMTYVGRTAIDRKATEASAESHWREGSEEPSLLADRYLSHAQTQLLHGEYLRKRTQGQRQDANIRCWLLLRQPASAPNPSD